MAVGGDIIEIQYNHPTLGSGTLYPKADEDSTFDPGGFRSADEVNGVDGAGNMIDTLTRRRWSLETTVSWDMNSRQELEAVIAMAGSTEQADWTITHVNGTVYGGKGKPVGDLAGAGKGATFPLKLSGGGIMKQI